MCTFREYTIVFTNPFISTFILYTLPHYSSNVYTQWTLFLIIIILFVSFKIVIQKVIFCGSETGLFECTFGEFREMLRNKSVL